MALQITSLNSGSNGNCYYVGNDSEAVLIDAGISCRETEKRMLGLGLSMQKVKAIFISHEHADHITGLPVIAKKFSLPVFTTPPTYAKSGQQIPSSLLNWFKPNEPIWVGELCITAFAKKHDAADANSFVINCKGITVGVFTDIGEPCSNVIHHFKQCHAAFLESNYDEDMLENGRYPYYLKNRIRGAYGHLSNKQALEIFIRHRPSFMSHLLLAHLSKDNNDPALVQSLFEKHAGKIKITVASRHECTPLFSVAGTEIIYAEKVAKQVSVQMGLFD
jgi:phosphoribosyl 1,2-cyclic phosphodiesterase